MCVCGEGGKEGLIEVATLKWRLLEVYGTDKVRPTEMRFIVSVECSLYSSSKEVVKGPTFQTHQNAETLV